LTGKGDSTRWTPGTDRTVKHSAKLDLGDYLPYLVNRVGTIIAEQFGGEALAPHRLSIAMWRVMAVLASNGSQRQIDLADLTSIEASTLSRLVTRLVRMGMVTRTRSRSSNREVAVKLSAKGIALVARLIPMARDYEAAAIAGLSRDEVTLLKRCLRRLFDNMKNRPAGTNTVRSRPRHK
jgi:MarR family transcriptional regulator, organic hydroperoxide resistance regulator